MCESRSSRWLQSKTADVTGVLQANSGRFAWHGRNGVMGRQTIAEPSNRRLVCQTDRERAVHLENVGLAYSGKHREELGGQLHRKVGLITGAAVSVRHVRKPGCLYCDCDVMDMFKKLMFLGGTADIERNMLWHGRIIGRGAAGQRFAKRIPETRGIP